MGNLTATAEVPNEVKVKGSWGLSQPVVCEMKVEHKGEMCPDINAARKEKQSGASSCRRCTKGYVQQSISTYILGNNTELNGRCDSWFTRADAVTRAAFAALRANSLFERINVCKQCRSKGPYISWTKGTASNCTSNGVVCKCLSKSLAWTKILGDQWTGTEDKAKAHCDAKNGCMYIHDDGADGKQWRVCKRIRSDPLPSNPSQDPVFNGTGAQIQTIKRNPEGCAVDGGAGEVEGGDG
jgi:hypothetical protein